MLKLTDRQLEWLREHVPDEARPERPLGGESTPRPAGTIGSLAPLVGSTPARRPYS